VLIAALVPNTTPSRIGFAVEGDEPTSPGPTIRVRKGATVTLTLVNDTYLPDGRPFGVPHNLAVVADKEVVWTEQVPLWGAHAGGFGDPNISEGERSSVTFVPEDAGTFYYICANVDHVHRGMWGQFTVEE